MKCAMALHLGAMPSRAASSVIRPWTATARVGMPARARVAPRMPTPADAAYGEARHSVAGEGMAPGVARLGKEAA